MLVVSDLVLWFARCRSVCRFCGCGFLILLFVGVLRVLAACTFGVVGLALVFAVWFGWVWGLPLLLFSSLVSWAWFWVYCVVWFVLVYDSSCLRVGDGARFCFEVEFSCGGLIVYFVACLGLLVWMGVCLIVLLLYVSLPLGLTFVCVIV